MKPPEEKPEIPSVRGVKVPIGKPSACRRVKKSACDQSLHFDGETEAASVDLPRRYKRDPIQRVIKYLTAIGLWDDERQKTADQEVAAEIDRVVEAAQAQRGVSPEMLFDNVYERPPERIERQRAEFLKSVNGH